MFKTIELTQYRNAFGCFWHHLADDAQVDCEGQQHRHRQRHLLAGASWQQEHQHVQHGQHHHGHDGVQNVERSLPQQVDLERDARVFRARAVRGRVEVGLGLRGDDVPLPVLDARLEADVLSAGHHLQGLVRVHPREELDLAQLVVERVLADVHLADGSGQYTRLPV